MKTTFRSVSSIAVAVLLAGAARLSAQSLWPAQAAGERGLVADHKASRVGDIVTVQIQESADATSSQSKKSSRESSLNDAVQQFIFPVAVSGLGTHAGQLPSFQNSGKSTYSGGGEVANSQSLVSRAAVVVIDVLPNGNLVIEGARKVIFSGEVQYVVLHGLVRPDDITSGNTVYSSNIADARVEFISEGSLTDVQKRGWLSRLYEKVRPF
jgi:flagellar L-ring protein precursor FlgH